MRIFPFLSAQTYTVVARLETMLTGHGKPLTNWVPFKFRQRSKNVEDKASSAGGGINRLLKAPESNPSLLQTCDDLNEIFQ